MARKLRLEFESAVYHVINRGNYRADLFRDDGTQPGDVFTVVPAVASESRIASRALERANVRRGVGAAHRTIGRHPPRRWHEDGYRGGGTDPLWLASLLKTLTCA
jgi:hypothetical protein